jgi:hypothetical protein
MVLPPNMSDEALLHHCETIGTAGLIERQVRKAERAWARRRKEQMALLARLVPEPQMRYIEFADLVDQSGHSVEESLVSELMMSIERVGLLNPPGVVLRDDVDMPDRSLCDGGPALVYGSHRGRSTASARPQGGPSSVCWSEIAPR